MNGLTRRQFTVGTLTLSALGGCMDFQFGEDRRTERQTGKEGNGMLKGISPALSPDMLKVLAEMGHGDEIVISDAHFPAHTVNERVIRADGASADKLLAGIIPLFELDAYATPVVMMAPTAGDTLDPEVERKYRAALGYDGKIDREDRYAFYERAKKAYAVILSGETAKYGNIILKKGVTPIS